MPRRVHWRYFHARLAVLVAIAAGTTSCEALVSDSLPSTIDCTGNLPGICPAGQACVGGKCGPPLKIVLPHVEAGSLDSGRQDAGHDSGQMQRMDAPMGDDAMPEATAPVDTGIDAPQPLGNLGDSCDTTPCASGLLCVLPADLPQLGLTTSVCSLPCCQDSDCMGGTCYPTTGGNLCITQAAASSCDGDCGTACCSDANCAKTETCALGTTHAGSSVPACKSTSECGHGGCGGDGASCTKNTDCGSGVCYNPEPILPCIVSGCFCLATCCNDGDCAADGEACQWVDTGSELLRACNQPTGTDASGSDCTPGDAGSSDCNGGICAEFPGQSTMLCSQPCCQDSDCTGIGTRWTCAPFSDEVGPGESAVLLVCQPPIPTLR